MRVKYNRALDGTSIRDSNVTDPHLSDYRRGKTNDPIDVTSLSGAPMKSKNRENISSGSSYNEKRKSTGCNFIFGPKRNSSSSSSRRRRHRSASPTLSSSSSVDPGSPQLITERSSSEHRNPSDCDRAKMTKLSNFLGIFKLTPSSNSSTNGSIKSSKLSPANATSIKVVRRDKVQETDGLFRTDSRRRRRANTLLQRNSDIRRSWNAARTGRPEVRSSWSSRPVSPSYRPTSPSSGIGNNYRSISPSVMSSSAYQQSTSQPASVNGSIQFGNSVRVNTMPAPIVTLPECCLEGSDSEVHIVTETKRAYTYDSGYNDRGYRDESPGGGKENELVYTSRYGDDEVDRSVTLKHVERSSQRPSGSIVRPSGPPPPPPPSSTATSVSYDGSVRSSDDVFIQVQITASSKKSSDKPAAERESLPETQRQGEYGKPDSCDECDRPLSPIFESCTEKINYEESISPTGSLVDSRTDSRLSNVEDVNTLLTNDHLTNGNSRPPSSSSGASSAEMVLSEDGGLGESVSCDTSSGCSWESSSILTGSVCLSPQGRDSSSVHSHSGQSGHSNSSSGMMSTSFRSSSSSPSPSRTMSPRSTSPRQHKSHHHLDPGQDRDRDNSSAASSPVMISNRNEDETYLNEPRMSEVIRVTVKKAEIPEVVTLRSEDIIDLESTSGYEETCPSPSSTFTSISSIQRIRHSTNRQGSRTGILKDSNSPNPCGASPASGSGAGAGGIHRSSTPKKVHFAESARVRSPTSMDSSNENEKRSYPQSPTVSPISHPSPPASTRAEMTGSPVNKFTSPNNNNFIGQQAQSMASKGPTLTTSSSVSIKKSSSKRLFHSSLNQNSVDGGDDRKVVDVIPGKTHGACSRSPDDYSGKQITAETESLTQVDPDSLSSSNELSSPISSCSLSVKSKAQFWESLSNPNNSFSTEMSNNPNDNGNVVGLEGRKGGKAKGGENEQLAINSEADDYHDQNRPDAEGNGKSNLRYPSGPNCTRSVEHVLNQNLTNNRVSISTLYVSSSSSAETDKRIDSNDKRDNNNPHQHSDNSQGNVSSAKSGFSHLSHELDAHRRLSALHQKKLAIARQESAHSSMIIQGLGVVVQRLTLQLDSLNGPTLRSQYKQLQNNFNQLEAAFVNQEDELRSLQVNYNKVESELREEIIKLTCELADEERRHEREKSNLINAFELELDAAREQFNQELASVEKVKDELKSIVGSLRVELKSKVNEMNQMKRINESDRESRVRSMDDKLTYMSKEIHSLKDVLELKENDLRQLRQQVERDEGLSRDLSRAQSTIDVLKQRLEQLEVARDSQRQANNRLKAENEALINEMIKDQREMDKLALRKEQLEYTLYNMVTITNGVDDRNNNNNESPIDYESSLQSTSTMGYVNNTMFHI